MITETATATSVRSTCRIASLRIVIQYSRTYSEKVTPPAAP